MRPLSGERFAQLNTGGGSDRTAIADDRILTNALDQATRPDGDLPRHGGIADAVKDIVSTLGNFTRRRDRGTLARFRTGAALALIMGAAFAAAYGATTVRRRDQP